MTLPPRARATAAIVALYVLLQAPLLGVPLYHDDVYNSVLFLRSDPVFVAPAAGAPAHGFPEWGRDWQRQLHIHPPFLSIFYSFWVRAFGDAERSLHLAAALAGLAAVLLWHRFALRFVSDEGALWAAALFCVSPAGLYYSSRAIHAPFESLAFAASLVALARALEQPGDRRRIRVLAACNVWGALVAYHYLVLLGLETILLLWRRDRLGLRASVAALPSVLAAAVALALLASASHAAYNFGFYWSTAPAALPRFFASIPFEVGR